MQIYTIRQYLTLKGIKNPIIMNNMHMFMQVTNKMINEERIQTQTVERIVKPYNSTRVGTAVRAAKLYYPII